MKRTTKHGVRNRIPERPTVSSQRKHRQIQPGNDKRCPELLLSTRFMTDQHGTTSSSSNIPNTSCTPVLLFLRSRDLCRVAKVCKSLYWQTQNRHLWKRLLQRQRRLTTDNDDMSNLALNTQKWNLWKYEFVRYYLERATKPWLRWLDKKNLIDRDLVYTPLMYLNRLHKILSMSKMDFKVFFHVKYEISRCIKEGYLFNDKVPISGARSNRLRKEQILNFDKYKGGFFHAEVDFSSLKRPEEQPSHTTIEAIEIQIEVCFSKEPLESIVFNLNKPSTTQSWEGINIHKCLHTDTVQDEVLYVGDLGKTDWKVENVAFMSVHLGHPSLLRRIENHARKIWGWTMVNHGLSKMQSIASLADNCSQPRLDRPTSLKTTPKEGPKHRSDSHSPNPEILFAAVGTLTAIPSLTDTDSVNTFELRSQAKGTSKQGESVCLSSFLRDGDEVEHQEDRYSYMRASELATAVRLPTNCAVSDSSFRYSGYVDSGNLFELSSKWNQVVFRWTTPDRILSGGFPNMIYVTAIVWDECHKCWFGRITFESLKSAQNASDALPTPLLKDCEYEDVIRCNVGRRGNSNIQLILLLTRDNDVGSSLHICKQIYLWS